MHKLRYDKLRNGTEIESFLVLAVYSLDDVRGVCVFSAGRLSLMELKEHDLFDQIEPENYAKILEGIITRMQAFQNSLPTKETLIKGNQSQRYQKNRCHSQAYVKT